MFWRSLAVWSACGAAAYASLLNVCALLFQCGCRAWWLGAAAHCNIHHSGVKHCPWCTLEPTHFWTLFAGFVLCQGVAVWVVRRSVWWRQGLAGLGAYLGAAALSALVLGLSQHYWN